jgi:hypothetical protein
MAACPKIDAGLSPLDRMEKPRLGIFDMGTKKPRPSRRTIRGGWNPTEED